MNRCVNDIRLSVPSSLMVVAVVGAAAFAAGRMTERASAVITRTEARAEEPMPQRADLEEPPAGHPGTARPDNATPLPAGHPGINRGPGQADPSAMDPGTAPEPSLKWKAPPRWKLVPSASAMRIATYRIPRAPGDPADAELSIVRAGGTVPDNADRWVAQFDPVGQNGAKRTTRTVRALDVTIVEVNGTYSGGMTPGASAMSDWGLLGAIVATPDMPHFFKLTGPAKSVAAARAEFDEFVGSFAAR